VLVVPAHGHAQAAPRARRALLGVDLRAADAGAGVAEAARWARQLGLVLDLAHVDSSRLHVPYILDPDVRHRFEQEWQTLQERDIAILDRWLAQLPAEQRGLARIGEGDPAEVLCELAPEYELVIVATHGRTGVDRLMLGSVAEKVMHRCPRPLLLLHASHAGRGE
jgi:nucleotide-binding universal stress UspA family protein